MIHEIETMHIMPGLFCNFSCSHCVNDSGPKRTEIISDSEILKISNEILRYAPKKLIFTGGEPTLHIDVINRLISLHPDFENVEIFITTNGWFSKSERSIQELLSKFEKISHLQLSYDTFHGSKISLQDIKRLRNYCETNGISFNVSVCISSPKEILAANILQKELGEAVIFQKVDATGRAKKNNLQFKYPVFESESLEKKCPNLGQISYIVNKGFSVCCSNLIFNSNANKQIYHDSVAKHLESKFYLDLSNKTFSELLLEKNISNENLPSEFSSPCRLCELAHKDC